MKNFIDISIPINPYMVLWPGSCPVEFKKWKDMSRGDASNDTELRGNVHMGTHLDAPLHFISDGRPVDAIPLEKLIGEAYVVEIMGSEEIDGQKLSMANIPSTVKKLLIKTNNSNLWTGNVGGFYKNFVAFTIDGAQWAVKQGIELIGIDYLSIQRYKDGPQVHQILLGSGVVILEGINLSEVKEGYYKLICLPLKLTGVEAAPARAILCQKL